MLLADAFPENIRQNFAQRNIDLGVAVLVKIPTFNVPYDKYAIYIAKDSTHPDIGGLVVINSEINDNVNRNAYLKSQHIIIDCQRHTFLKHDSFVDCTQIHPHSLNEIIEYIKENPDHLCGNVHPDILKSVSDKLVASILLSKNEKEKYSLK